MIAPLLKRIISVFAFVLPSIVSGQTPSSITKNLCTHVVTNLSLTTVTCLTDGKLAYLSKGEQVQLVARHTDDSNEYNIIRIAGRGEYYMLSSFSEYNNAVSLTIKSDGKDDPSKSTAKQITLLKDTLRTDEQNQDFIVPYGKEISILFKGEKYAKISVRYNDFVYVGYVLTEYLDEQNYKGKNPATHRVIDSRDQFDFSIVSNRQVIGEYEIEAVKNSTEIISATLQVHIGKGLPKFKMIRQKKSINGKVLSEITGNHSSTDDGFVFYDNTTGRFTFGAAGIGVIHFSVPGPNTFETDNLVYTIKKTK